MRMLSKYIRQVVDRACALRCSYGERIEHSYFWQLCAKMSIMGLGLIKCMLKSNGVARLYYVEGV